MRRPPVTVILLGVAGLIPFLGCGLGALSQQGEWARLSQLGLAAYGAVILSFLGAVHWGVALTAVDATARVQRARYVLGVVPALIGWAGLMVVFLGLPRSGLVVLAVGIAAMTVVEGRAARAGLVPPGYMVLRWVLSVIVTVVLMSVVMVELLGGRIVL